MLNGYTGVGLSRLEQITCRREVHETRRLQRAAWQKSGNWHKNLLDLLRLVYMLPPRSKYCGSLSRHVPCWATFTSASDLSPSQLACALNFGRRLVLSFTAAAAGCLDALDNREGRIIGNFTEHDMLPVEP